MSSQAGSSGINSSGGVVSVSGIGNVVSAQGCSNSGSGVKSNSKMANDHQATLDKGLKMKIKRTKPGTKTSEAKHEIVKASEQQNGVPLGNSNVADNAVVNASINNNSSSASNNAGNISTGLNSSGSKKHIGSTSSTQNINHNSLASNTGCIIPSNSNSGPHISSSGQTNLVPGNKRGSSSHRRDKTKDKSTHSNRSSVDKNLSSGNEKEPSEKLACQCSGELVGNNMPCSNNLCIRRNEISGKLNERMSNSNSKSLTNMSSGMYSAVADNHNIPVVKPSVGSAPAVSSTNIMTVTSSVNSSTGMQMSCNNSNSTNAPGPPTKDTIGGGGNLKGSASITGAANALNTTASTASDIPNTNCSPAEGKTASSFSTNNNSLGQVVKHMAPGVVSATVRHTISVPLSSHASGAPKNGISPLKSSCSSSSTLSTDDHSRSPPAKRSKHSSTDMNTGKEMVDICVGTSVGTITEPDCLGPCEPGTSVTLEGIVWHETEGGVLVVNVTWRGKTYVGTLLDCTRHDWAPPRFCESPTEELDSRTPKGRGKRGRSAVLTPDLSNFTETRSSVHSKLRNGSTKGGRTTARSSNNASSSSNSGVSLSGNNSTLNSNSSNGTGSTPSTSPTAFLPSRPEKRKSKEESPPPPPPPPPPATPSSSTTSEGGEMNSLNMMNASGIPISASGGGLATQPQSFLNPVTGLNVQINTKKCKTTSPCAISPVLLECPEQDCRKKYKHPNGLRYHQSHAHGSGASMDEDSTNLPEMEEPPSTSSPSSPSAPPPAITPNPNDIPISTVAASPTPITAPITESPAAESTSITNTFGNMITGPPSECVTSSYSSMEGPPPNAAPTTSVGALVASNTQNHEELITEAAATVGGGSITAGISNQVLAQQKQQQQQQLVDLAVKNSNASNLITTEQNMFPPTNTVKSGVLRFGQSIDSKTNPTSVRNTNVGGVLPQTQLPVVNSQQQMAIIPGVSATSLGEQQTQLRPLPNVIGGIEFNTQAALAIANKSIANFSLVGKQKKNRKSPCLGESIDDGSAGAANNITTRDDVQSPAYSDISDDSNPITNGDAHDKNESTKNLDVLNKKPQDMDIAASSGTISAGQHALPAGLGGYNMYQFFQQQQFIVQHSSEHQQQQQQQQQQQLNKSNLTSGIIQSSNQLATLQNPQHPSAQLVPTHNLPQLQQQQQQQQQQQPSSHLDYSNKTKDPPLDLNTKNTASQQQNHQMADANKSQDLTMSTQQPNANNLNNATGPTGQTCGSLGGSLNSLTALGPNGLPPSSKSMQHFYPFNYMTSGYSYNVDSNYGPVSIVSTEDAAKMGSNSGDQSPGDHISQQQMPTAMIKEDRIKDVLSPQENLKTAQQHINLNKVIKTEPMIKQEANILESNSNVNVSLQSAPQQPLALHPKDMQAYTNMYQRHPISLASHQLSREEELRRYYVFSDQHRRQNNTLQILNVNNQQVTPGCPQPGHVREDGNTSQQQQHQQQQQQHQQQHTLAHQQSMKLKQNSSNVGHVSVNKIGNHNKDSPKQKQEEDMKVGKQEGQKPTMETQGPPPPPTSQYFLHPSYIAPTPFGFDPNHPMYRNVLMSATPYNTQPYHLPIPRYHAPEDLSRNTTTKALDALHHAANQYYTTHKIHELSERALKSPNSVGNNGSNNPGTVKVSVPSPGMGQTQQNNTSGNAPHHHSSANPSGNAQLLNMPAHSNLGAPSSKPQDVLTHKSHGNSGGPAGPNAAHPESQKQQAPNVPPGLGGTGNNNPNSNPSDSRSPPPQRHVHTHHHTHVGLGYPMYPAPYGAAVLASQQAAAVAVINPFPPAPSK